VKEMIPLIERILMMKMRKKMVWNLQVSFSMRMETQVFKGYLLMLKPVSKPFLKLPVRIYN
jgi:hypothetical protein